MTAPAVETGIQRHRVASVHEVVRAEQDGLPLVGVRIFFVLVALIVVVMALLAGYAALTYPDRATYLPASGVATPEQSQAFEAAVAAWVTQIKDLGQIFLLTPVFPLLGTVLGYIFGREKRNGAEG